MSILTIVPKVWLLKASPSSGYCAVAVEVGSAVVLSIAMVKVDISLYVPEELLPELLPPEELPLLSLSSLPKMFVLSLLSGSSEEQAVVIVIIVMAAMSMMGIIVFFIFVTF
jgi:hypothetical protein